MLTLSEVKAYLGLTGTDDDALLQTFITAADEDLTSKVGSYDPDSEKAKLYMKYFVGIIYSDRFGELSLKENSALRNAMENIIFNLRLECCGSENGNE